MLMLDEHNPLKNKLRIQCQIIFVNITEINKLRLSAFSMKYTDHVDLKIGYLKIP